jgi:hypothetical protein
VVLKNSIEEGRWSMRGRNISWIMGLLGIITGNPGGRSYAFALVSTSLVEEAARRIRDFSLPISLAALREGLGKYLAEGEPVLAP